MYQIQFYVDKDEPKKLIWITETEYEGIRRMLNEGAKFITIGRLDKTINTRDIKEIGIPDFIRHSLKIGKVLFAGDSPIIQKPEHGLYYLYEMGSWNEYEGKIIGNNIKTFEEYIGENSIKKLK
jgi:hypothetical protein